MNKILRLSILFEKGISKAALANIFGKYNNYTFNYTNNTSRWIQFEFPSIKFLIPMHLKSIHDLLVNYEQEHGELTFKMFDLFDNKSGAYSPISIHCLRGRWSTCESLTGEELISSPSLFSLF